MEQGNVEHRKYERFELPCPVVVSDEQGRELFQAEAINVSDGGMLITAPADQAIPVGETVHLALKVPRAAANTRESEDFFSNASVIRHQPSNEEGRICIALEFSKRLLLGLDG